MLGCCMLHPESMLVYLVQPTFMVSASTMLYIEEFAGHQLMKSGQVPSVLPLLSFIRAHPSLIWDILTITPLI